MKVKEESKNASLKLNIQKTKIIASSPITWWQVGGETMETVADFISLDSKIAADGDCNHEIKYTCSMEAKDSILKIREFTLPTDIHLVKAMAFPVPCMDVRVGL